MTIILTMILSGCSSTKNTEDLMSLGGGDGISIADEKKNDTSKAFKEIVKEEKKKENKKTEDKSSQEKTENKSSANTNTKSETKTQDKKESKKTNETKSKTETKSEPKAKTSKTKLDSMSDSEKKEINKFLSNFSEASYTGTKGGKEADAEKISFAFTHTQINNSDEVVYNDLQKGISADVTDKVLERFFGESVPHETPDGSLWIYDNGYFMTQATDDDSCAYFSAATAVKDNNDGTYSVDFNIYHNYNNPHQKIDDECYSFSDNEASKNYKKTGSGKAIIEPMVYNGENTYQLVYYKLN